MNKVLGIVKNILSKVANWWKNAHTLKLQTKSHGISGETSPLTQSQDCALTLA